MKKNELATLPKKIRRLKVDHRDKSKDPDRRSSLDSINDSLSTEIENLESALVTSDEASFYDAGNNLENLEADDKTDEVVIEGLIDSAGRLIIRTINDLSSKLVSVNEELNRARNQNVERTYEIDRLRAMIRVSSGDDYEYRKRINELHDFVRQMHRETCLLKSNHEKANCHENSKIPVVRINCLKSLMNELRTKLKNDREALFTGGNRWCSLYIKKIRKLEYFSESLLIQLETTSSDLQVKTCSIKLFRSSEYQREISEIEQLVKRLAYDLKSLITMPIKIGSRVGGESCAKYFRKIRTLEKLVTSSSTIIDKLIVDSQAIDELEGTKIIKNCSQFKESVETLEILAKNLTSGIKQLEMVVAAGDGSYLFKKINLLESSVKRLKRDLVAREDEKNSLILELKGAKIAYVEKVEELKTYRGKYEKIVNRMKKRGESLDTEEQIACLLRELDQSKLNANALQDEVNQLKPEVTNIQAERAKLVDEIEKIRSIVEAKSHEIVKMTAEQKSKERTFTKETNERKTILASAEKEIKCLKKEIFDLNDNMEIKERNATTELKSLKSLYKNTKDNLDSKDHKLSDLESKLKEIIIEKTKIENELSCLTKQNEALIVCVNSEKATHSKELKDFEKLKSDLTILNDNLAGLETEKKNLRKNLDLSERDKKDLKAEIDEQLRKNLLIDNESSSLKTNLTELTREFEKTKKKNHEINEQLKRFNGENNDRVIRLDSLTKENEKLKDELDRARSDKLNIAGSLNEAKYNCELTKKLLDEKINETRSTEEKLKITVVDLELVRTSENLAKLKMEKLLETNERLRETIDIGNSDKVMLEKRLKDVENDFQALENKLVTLNNEKNTLTSESFTLNRRIDELTEELTTLRSANGIEAEEHSKLIGEHEKMIAALREKLTVFESERANHASEMTRINDENSSLKRDYEEIVCEYEKIQTQGKKSDVNRLRGENEILKLELSKLLIFVSGADREVAKNEMEKMCSELVEIRAENSALKKLRKRRIFDEKFPRETLKLEEQLRAWKTENKTLRESLESARNKIAINDERTKEFETERNMLKGSIEGLKERYKISRREIDDGRLINERLNNEIIELKKYLETTRVEDFALKRELKNLQINVKSLNEENSKMRKNLSSTASELAALKDELAKLRTENVSLNAQFDGKNTDSRNLETENASLRNELEETRRSRMLAIEKTNELRSDHEQLVTLRVTLESKLIDAQKEIGKYVVATAKLNDLENKLKPVLKSYVITKKLLRSANEEIDHLRHFVNPCSQSFNYGEKIQAT